MYLSYNWLKELTGCKISPEKLAEILNLQVAAVESFKKMGEGLDKIIVAEILAIKKHPQADKLQLVKITTDNKKQTIYNIVCGAFNIKVGDRVPLAWPGAKLPNGVEIKEAVIRGEKSVGMLCAEDELGLGGDHAGILMLDKSAKIGERISKVLELDDVILEIETVALTHRPDLFGHLGWVREIAAITGKKLKNIGPRPIRPGRKKEKDLRIKIEDYKDCSRYMGVVMDNIRIAPSPGWLQNRLRNLGIRPINNVVDITNYILLEVGQPLHAFDFYKLDSSMQKLKMKNEKFKIINIRRAKSGEKLITLDGIERTLDRDILVIADAKKPIALAGIMGGEKSGINEKTKTIVIESANFDPTVIRIGAKKTGLRTEANIRFEKNLPLIFAEQGMRRAIKLIEEIAGGKVASQIYDVKDNKTKKILKTKKNIALEIKEIVDLIGEKISESQITKYLGSLGFIAKKIGKILHVTVPVHRNDIECQEDIVEEIARIYGYQQIRPQPIQAKLELNKGDQLLKMEKELKNIFVGLGFDEVYNYSFYSEKSVNNLKIKIDDHLELANPLNPEQRYLRLSLLPKLLENANKNVNNFEQFRIFETGKIFKKNEKSFEQEKFFGGLILERSKDIFRLSKGLVEKIIVSIGINQSEISYQLSQHHNYQYLNNLVGIIVKGQVVGLLGIVSEEVKNHFKPIDSVGVFEINLDKLAELRSEVKLYQKISVYPSIIRDLAFLVPKNIIFSEVIDNIKKFNRLICLVDPFDVFESEKIGKDVRNIAFRLTFQSFDKTLKSEEVDKIIADLVKTLEQKFGVKLRNF